MSGPVAGVGRHGVGGARYAARRARSQEAEGGGFGVQQVAVGGDEGAADAVGAGVEGGHALAVDLGAVTITDGVTVERQAQFAAVPLLGGPHKAGLRQADAVMPAGEGLEVGGAGDGGGVLQGERRERAGVIEGGAFGWGRFHWEGSGFGVQGSGKTAPG